MARVAVVYLLALATLWRLHYAEGINITLSSPTKLPPFVPRCSFKDPDIHKCCVDAANIVLPKMMKGYPPLRIPSLDPLVIDEIAVDTGKGPSSLKLSARNIVLSGLTKTIVDDIGFDINNQIYTVFASTPEVHIVCDYEIDGKILLLQLKGQGKATFIFENAKLTYVQGYRLVKRSDGDIYHELISHAGNFTTSRAHFNLSNLFNGDKVLGQQINSFLNENWKEVMVDIGDPFIEATIEIINQFALSLVGKMPYSEVYTDVDLDIVEKMQKVIKSN